VLARAVLILAALATAAWLAVTLPSVRAQEEGEAIVDRPVREKLSAADVDRGLDAFERARRRQPDGGILPLEAQLLIRAGQRDRAAAVLAPLVRDEPRNVTAWATLSVALAQRDPAAANRARARARELAPPVR
jgi:predicted Zn-dependent protease